jgi:uncharacterized protein
LAFLFSTVNIFPEFLEKNYKDSFLASLFNFKFYSGIKEGVYLSQQNFSSSKNSLGSKKSNIYVRLEPDTADYYSGNTEFLDNLLISLSISNNVKILPRNKEQSMRFNDSKFSNIEIATKPLTLENIYENCDLFIGAGGSMSRELAFLNITTLSIYQDELLEVDKFLVSKKLMHHNPAPKYEDIELLLHNSKVDIDNELIEKGLSAFNLINAVVNDLRQLENKNAS